MASYTHPPVGCVFQGEASIPDKFIVSYKADLSNDPTFPTIQFYGIENDGSALTLTDAVELDGRNYDAKIVKPVLGQLIGYYWVISNMEYLREMNGIVMVTKHAVPVIATLGFV